MSKIAYSLILVPLLLLSCNTVYNEKNEEVFGDMLWFQKEIITFNPEIEDNSFNYDLDFTLSHFYQIGLENFPVVMKVTSPSGIETAKQYDLVFKDEQGESLTSCSGDYCDLTQTIETNYSFPEKGIYTVELIQPQPVVKGVTSLRLSISKK